MCVCVCVYIYIYIYIYNQHSGGLDTRPTSLRTWVLVSTINYALYISSPSQMVDLKNKVSLGVGRVLLYIYIYIYIYLFIYFFYACSITIFKHTCLYFSLSTCMIVLFLYVSSLSHQCSFIHVLLLSLKHLFLLFA